MKPKKLIPPLYFYVLLLASIALGLYLPVLKVFPSPYAYGGIAPIATGIVLNLWADSMFKKNKTTVKPYLRPSTLMTAGVFRVSRNPMYLGMTLILLGVSIWVGSLAAFVSPVLSTSSVNTALSHRRVMEAIFGQSYRNYKKSVRRWV